MNPKLYNFICKFIDDTGVYIRFSQFAGYIDKDLTPLRCHKCGSRNYKTKTTDTINGYSVEEDAICKDCGAIIGHWAYGYWSI